MVITKTNKDLKPVLMTQSEGKIKEPYYLIIDNDQVIFVISAGHNGIEFNKTVGYFSNFPGMQLFKCLYGKGILIMQRNDENGEAKEFKVVSLNPGRQIVVPAGCGMCLVNISTNLLVVIRNNKLDKKYKNSKPILEKGGFAYYIVEKKGEISFEPNPKYLIHPQITPE